MMDRYESCYFTEMNSDTCNGSVKGNVHRASNLRDKRRFILYLSYTYYELKFQNLFLKEIKQTFLGKKKFICLIILEVNVCTVQISFLY